MKPDNIILEGVTGSTAYGLATEGSDVDIKGIYMLPTTEVMRLRFSLEHQTRDNTDPDWCYHEVGKFMKLAAGGNPTVSELLFLAEYTKMSPVGELLVNNRNIFLSTKGVQKAYRGYALGQALSLSNRQREGKEGYDSALKNRYAKHTRHCFRLLLQAKELMDTGTLTVKVTPEQREWLFEMGTKKPNEVVAAFKIEDSKLNNYPSVLPEEPDWEAIDKLYYQIRMKPMGNYRG